MAHLIIVGTSHISKQSIADIKRAITTHKPDIVAIELDAQRLHGLLNKQRTRIRFQDIRRIGVKGALFALIGSYIQRKLGRMVGTAPGSDMLTAVKQARENKIPIALIDRDITITLRRFSKALTWKERFRFLGDIIRGIIFPKSELKRYGIDKIDLKIVPSQKLITKMIAHIEKRYPSIYKTLIEERNVIMITRLKQLFLRKPDATIVAVVGAGHKEAIKNAFTKE